MNPPYPKQPPKDFQATMETRNKMSIAKLGKIGEESNPWKGDSASYSAIHRWLRRHYGNPKKCAHCGKTDGRLGWANKDHKYKRNIEEYIGLCASCHKIYDNRMFRIPHTKRCIVCDREMKTFEKKRKYCSTKCTGVYWYRIKKYARL